MMIVFIVGNRTLWTIPFIIAKLLNSNIPQKVRFNNFNKSKL